MPHDKSRNGIELLKILMEKQFLDGMARIVSEIQTINIWIDNAKTNRIARIRYQKSKPRPKELVESHKPLMRAYEALTRSTTHVPARDHRGKYQKTLSDEAQGEEAHDQAYKPDP
jgi:hypothetical protein